MDAEEMLAYLADLLLMYLEELKDAKQSGENSFQENRRHTRNVWKSYRSGKGQRKSGWISISKRNIHYRRKEGIIKNVLFSFVKCLTGGG